ncbi:ATP-dependent DNA helicase RecQ2 [Aquaticitalea lipolytica]|uniref:ATP-dependent DNA helicase RecQ n=1 Tax=Aquaticitalea lipolytica TaxID=1247562 RepID=A0A8J2TLR9_9FLAO|nr:RecQ family ATP-dependent DNA helicase [Aquaticitalea lipolytica]GFZ76773.1 ATP-dependent DNA helicase RecQ2 [Aquaticitalea lipolytica]
MQHPIQILERYWNHTSFRPLQEDIINAVLNNEDVFALLPTGGGKSVCFQIPALIKDGICIVVSPLIALMKDQVNTLNQKGIKAMAITSGISYSDLDTMLDNCIYGNYKFLYVSPERLQQDLVRDRIQQMNVNLIAVDEAHCISQWGNDFRPAYKNITVLRQLHPTVNIIALTATAKPKVVEDVSSELDFIAPKIFKASFARPNIAYMVLETDDKLYKIEQILKKHKGSSIIYVRNRKATIETHSFLENKGFSSTFYHGGINSKEKEERLHQWTNNQKEIMVATTAFGMGIDKPDVKTIIHINLPESLESYYQEAGRAGRNGEKAFAVVLKNKTDEQKLKHQFLNALPTIDFLKTVYRKLCNYFQVSYGEGELSTHQFNFNSFCKAYDFNSVITFNALQVLDRNSIISLSQQFRYQTKLQFIVTNQALFNYLETRKHIDVIIKSILRTYGGILEHLLKINTTLIAEKASTTEENVIKVLQQLNKDEIVNFQFSNTDSEIIFLQPREDDKTINRISRIVQQQNDLKELQIKAVIDYVNNDRECKNKILLNYFGEKTTKNCGMCSYCISNKKSSNAIDVKAITHNIILLLEEEPLNSRKIVETLPFTEQHVLDVLKLMVENNILIITATNTYKIKHT